MLSAPLSHLCRGSDDKRLPDYVLEGVRLWLGAFYVGDDLCQAGVADEVLGVWGEEVEFVVNGDVEEVEVGEVAGKGTYLGLGVGRGKEVRDGGGGVGRCELKCKYRSP